MEPILINIFNVIYARYSFRNGLNLFHVDLTESCRVLDVRCLLCFTGQLHPDLSGSQRLVSMRLEWTPLTSFEALQAKAW